MSLVGPQSLLPTGGLLALLLSVRLWVEHKKNDYPIGLYVFKGQSSSSRAGRNTASEREIQRAKTAGREKN